MNGPTLAATRRQLIEMRIKNAGNRALTSRISNLIGQIETLEAGAACPDHAARLRAGITKSLIEIEQIQRDGGQYIHANHGAGR